MKVQKAITFPVPFGNIEIEGLLKPAGNFSIGLSQVAILGLVPRNRSLKQIKALTGLGFQSHEKIITDLNPKAVNAISLDDLALIQKWALSEKIDAAIDLAVLCTGFTFHQLFADAAGIKLDADDRQRWLESRQKGMVARKSFTKLVQEHGVAFNYKPNYGALTNLINKAAKIPCIKGIRERLGEKQLSDLEFVENAVARLMSRDSNLSPEAAIAHYVDTFCSPVEGLDIQLLIDSY